MRRLFAVLFLVFCVLPACAEVEYVEVASVRNVPIVELRTIEDVQVVARKNGISVFYLEVVKGVHGQQVKGPILHIFADGLCFSFPLDGYLTVDDYVAGTKLAFKDGNDYNESKELGFADSAMYYFYKQNKFESVEDCKDAWKKGFNDPNFREWANKSGFGFYPPSGNDSRAYYHAKKLGAADYADFQELYQIERKGFKSRADFQKATRLGFDGGGEYYVAMEGGFPNNEEYKKAKDMRLGTFKEYTAYNSVVKSVEEIRNAQKISLADSFVYEYLRQLPKGQMSLSVLSRTLLELCAKDGDAVLAALDSYCRKESDPASRLSNNGTIKALLSESGLTKFFGVVDIGKIGKYDVSSGIFTRK